jgi:hypothetical protein
MERELVRRAAPTRPLVWLGEAERVSDVSPTLGARFPATAMKARDFALPPIVRTPRDPVG